MLIVDLADHLLHDVLDGDDTDGAAVLVDDDRKLQTGLLHLAEEIVDALGLRGIGGRAHERAQVRRGGPAPQEVHRGDHPHDVEGAVGEHRDAREAALADEAHGLVRRRAIGQRRHVHQRDHHLPDGGVAEVEDLVDHLGLGDGHVGLRRLHLEQELELFSGDELSGARPRPTQEAQSTAHDRIGGPGER